MFASSCLKRDRAYVRAADCKKASERIMIQTNETTNERLKIMFCSVLTRAVAGISRLLWAVLAISKQMNVGDQLVDSH